MTAYDDALAILDAGGSVHQSVNSRSRYASRDYRRRYFSRATIERVRAARPVYWAWGGWRLVPEGFERVTMDGYAMIPAGSQVITWDGRIRTLETDEQAGLHQWHKPPTVSARTYDDGNGMEISA